MFTPAHVFETALLILVAFLAGAALGALARRLTLLRQAAAPVPVEAQTLPTGPQLVVAPEIVPVDRNRPRTAAERLAAAAGREVEAPPAAATAEPAPVPESASPPEPALIPEPAAVASEAAETTVVASESGPPAESAAPLLVPGMQPAVSIPAIDLPAFEIAARSAPAPVAATSDIAAIEAVEGASPLVAAEAIPDVEPEAPDEPVRAADVPPIDETMHVIERYLSAAIADDPGPAGDVGYAPGADLPEASAAPTAAPVEAAPAEPEPASPLDAGGGSDTAPFDDDAEAAAMRAIEGGWSPRGGGAPSRPVPHPEAAPDVDRAMSTARDAVAAATAAAEAAIATAGLPASFEAASAGPAASFLDGDAQPADGGLDFEPASRHRAFGQPEGLAGPRPGGPDNLRQIKGITPALESSLNQLGIYHFDQIAGWDQKAMVWMDNQLALKGRIARERWLDQARDLARGARPVQALRR